MLTISLTGAISQSARTLEGVGDPGLAVVLRELLKNLAELRERKAEGQKVLDEFFRVYVIQPERDAPAVPLPTAN
jgi:hypothetical protein